MAVKDRDPKCTDTWRAVCPHCYHEHQGSWEWQEGTVECSQCDKRFEMERVVDISFNTIKAAE